MFKYSPRHLNYTSDEIRGLENMKKQWYIFIPVIGLVFLFFWYYKHINNNNVSFITNNKKRPQYDRTKKCALWFVVFLVLFMVGFIIFWTCILSLTSYGDDFNWPAGISSLILASSLQYGYILGILYSIYRIKRWEKTKKQ